MQPRDGYLQQLTHQRLPVIVNPRAASVTDRAHRYRANAAPPPGPKRCLFCGSRKDIQVGHLDGHEENDNPSNLVWTCRSCNGKMSHAFKRAGLGRRTRQFNPAGEGAPNYGAWMNAVAKVTGKGNRKSNLTIEEAVDLIHNTPKFRRREYSEQLWKIRKERYGASGRRRKDSEVPF